MKSAMQKVSDTTDVEGAELYVPQDSERRLALELAIVAYVQRERLVPPLTGEELAAHARCASSAVQATRDEQAYVAVLLNNALWADVVAGIPYERRLLLLPQCLANVAVCQADRDGLGLLCQQCGGCSIGVLQAEADRLGYVTLVAEGTTVVSKLLTSGKVDAVIGVGCMDSLRRIFPIMNAHAIPGQGVPLLADGCTNTVMDVAWALGIIRAGKPKLTERVTASEAVAHTVQTWFEPASVASVMGVPNTEAERIGQQWLMTGGKRWRRARMPRPALSYPPSAGRSAPRTRSATISRTSARCAGGQRICSPCGRPSFWRWRARATIQRLARRWARCGDMTAKGGSG
jgi:hypothetical protein